MSCRSPAPLLLLAAVAAAGCGFRPLYAERDGAQAALAAIGIAPIEHRAGQRLRNLLLERLNPAGEPGRPRYALDVRLAERRQDLAIRKDATATRANLVLTATYRLERRADGETLLRGEARSTNSYNIVDNPFAALAAERDARIRAVRELAETLKLRLALFLSRAR